MTRQAGPISLAWQAARAGTHPQIFLTNQVFFQGILHTRIAGFRLYPRHVHRYGYLPPPAANILRHQPAPRRPQPPLRLRDPRLNELATNPLSLPAYHAFILESGKECDDSDRETGSTEPGLVVMAIPYPAPFPIAIALHRELRWQMFRWGSAEAAPVAQIPLSRPGTARGKQPRKPEFGRPR